MMKSLMALSATVLLASPTLMARDITIVGQTFPPFNWEEGGEIKGGMVDVLKEACKELKHNCKFEIHALARGLKMLEDGEVDAVMSLAPNKDREAYSNFSPTIIITDIVLMGNKKNLPASVKSPADLSGWTIAGVRAASSLKNARAWGEANKEISYKEDTDNKTLSERGESNFHGPKSLIVGSEDVLSYFGKADGNNELKAVYKVSEDPYFTAFGKKKVSAEEFEAFTKTIEKLKKDGTVKKILSKYNLRTN